MPSHRRCRPTNLRAKDLAAWKPSAISMTSQMRARSGTVMETGRNRACKNGWGWDVGVGVWTGRAAPPPRRATTTPHPAAHHPPVTPRLQAFRQLRSARVAWVHGDERHGRRAQWDARALKLEARLAAAQGVQHRLVLGGAHRQHLQCSCEGRGGARVGGVGGNLAARRCTPATARPNIRPSPIGQGGDA